ncbi:MAG: DUF4276 family protein [Bacteroidia bacterium]|nr:DUF4276 family protein [Bacteroidia bacterium]
MATKKVILFVEGESNSPNGDLRQGLAKLLEKKLGGKLPSIKLGDGKSQTIKKFLKNRLPCDLSLLLVDLDKPADEIEQDLKEYGLLLRRDDVFYMIQEMESWFLSQPEILDRFYGQDNNGKKVSDKLTQKNPIEYPHPDEEIQRLTKHTKKGGYHKIKHGVELLKLLDAAKLEDDFNDFKRLITRINE